MAPPDRDPATSDHTAERIVVTRAGGLVQIVIDCGTPAGAGAFAQRILDQLRDGGMTLRLSCPPDAVFPGPGVATDD